MVFGPWKKEEALVITVLRESYPTDRRAAVNQLDSSVPRGAVHGVGAAERFVKLDAVAAAPLKRHVGRRAVGDSRDLAAEHPAAVEVAIDQRRWGL